MVINEVLYLPGRAAAEVPGYEIPWVELLNVGDGPVNVGGWSLSNRDGLALTVLPDWDVPAGCYLTVHFGAGVNDNDFTDCEGHFWTEGAPYQVFLPLIMKNFTATSAPASPSSTPPGPFGRPHGSSQPFDEMEDECALYAGPPSTATIVDFVAWSGDGDYDPGTAHDYAVAAGIWTAGDFLDTSDLGPVDTIGRIFNGYDANKAADWWVMPWTDFVRPGISQPENPIQYLPEKYIVLTDTTPTFDWADVPWVDSYRLQVDNDRDFSSPVLDVSGLAASTYTPTTPLASDLYFYRIAGQVGGEETRWSAAWLFVVDAGGLQTLSTHRASCPFFWQRKDTDLLCLYNMGRFDSDLRPGCRETGEARWDGPHPEEKPWLPHNRMNCCPASIAMVNARYGGDLSQDRISYQTFHNYLDGPEGDLGHDLGYSDGEIRDTLSWALNGATITHHTGPFTFAQLQQWIKDLDCFVATIPGHCLVPDGYAELSMGEKLIQVLYINDPWRGPHTRKVYAWEKIGAPQPEGLQADLTNVFLQPQRGVTGRKQEASVTMDSDGDGVMDFDEIHRFHTDPDNPDTDGDEVPDKKEIRSYTFYDTDPCGGDNDPLNFPDIDGDGLRAERDCDTDDGGGFDGGEDVNGNGVDCEPGETDPYRAADDEIWITTDKGVYLVGQDVYITGRRFHANSDYPYEIGPGCPDFVSGDAITPIGRVGSDDTGTIPEWTWVWKCPEPGEYYIVVDVLKDGHYSEPDNRDPYTCFFCSLGAELGVTKSDEPDPVLAGEELRYTVVVTNNGPSDAAGVVVTDTLPTGVTFSYFWPEVVPCTEEEGIVTCELGTIPAGESTTMGIAVQVSPTTVGTLTNMVQVSSQTPDPDMENNTAVQETTACPVIVDLGTLPGHTWSDAYGVNDLGQVVGQSVDAEGISRAFLWSEGEMIDLGTLPGHVESEAHDVNNAGQVVGQSVDAEWISRAFLWSEGEMIDLGTLPGHTESRAHAINDAGQVAGNSYAPDGKPRAFIWIEGEMIDLGVLPGHTQSAAFGINDAGQVVGDSIDAEGMSHAFLWSEGEMIDLGTLPGHLQDGANDINNLGQVVGRSVDADWISHAFLWSDGVMTDLGANWIAHGINDAGQVVGTMIQGGMPVAAVLWEDGVLTDLNDLLPPGSGWELLEARDISNNGAVVGWGMLNGEMRAFYLALSSDACLP